MVLRLLGAEGQEFDPAQHEAVGQEERKDLEEGRICRMVQKGYKLKDRLIRPARVLVSKCP
jgi:molecular chaperone GrpE